MTLVERVTSAGATATQMFVSFWPWLLAAGVLCAAPAAFVSFKVTRAFYQRDALVARAETAQIREGLATAAAAGEAEAAKTYRNAIDTLRAHNDAQATAVAAIPNAVAAMLAPKFTALRESLNAPEYDCLRRALPDDSLRLLERPGGVAAADRANPGGAGAVRGL